MKNKSFYIQMNKRQLAKADGQALPEYSLALGLITLVAIGSLIGLSGSINDLFSNMVSVSGGNKPTVKTALSGATSLPQVPVPAVLTPVSNGTALANLPGKIMTVDLGNGRSIQINAADFKAAAETMGPNGVSGNALSILDQVVQQLKEQGDSSDQAVIQKVAQLSKLGHKLANVQALFQQGAGNQTFENAQTRNQFYDVTKIPLGPNGPETSLSELYYKYLYVDSRNSQDQVGIVMKKGGGSPTDVGTAIGSLFNETKILSYFDKTYAGGKLASEYNGIGEKYIPGRIREGQISLMDEKDPKSNFGSIQEFLAQLNVVRNSGLYDKYPPLKGIVDDLASKQLYLGVLSTPYKLNTQELVGLTDNSRTQSKVICKESRAVSCENRPEKTPPTESTVSEKSISSEGR
jgi:Flp pilus assembly pilin Flp